MKIIFTKHAAVDKFEMLKKHKFKSKVTKRLIKKVIQHPENLDTTSRFPQIIASRTLDAKRILRVVYRKEGDIIIVITFFPAEQGRYYEKKPS